MLPPFDAYRFALNSRSVSVDMIPILLTRLKGTLMSFWHQVTGDGSDKYVLGIVVFGDTQ
jgi:hypothetical protein